MRDLHLHWYLPFLQSEISNLKFEIVCSLTFSATSLAGRLFPVMRLIKI